MKTYSDSTLKGMSKAELIRMIRCLENNVIAVEERNDNQYRILTTKWLHEEMLKEKLKDMRKKAYGISNRDSAIGRLSAISMIEGYLAEMESKDACDKNLKDNISK